MSSSGPTGQASGRNDGSGNLPPTGRVLASTDASNVAQRQAASPVAHGDAGPASLSGQLIGSSQFQEMPPLADSASMSMASMAAALPTIRSAQAGQPAHAMHRVPAGMLSGLVPSQQPHMVQYANPTAAGAQVATVNQGPHFAQPYPQHGQQPFAQQNFFMGPTGGPAQTQHPGAYQTQSFHSPPYYGGQQQQQQGPGYLYYPQGYAQMNPPQAFQGPIPPPGGMPVGSTAFAPAGVTAAGLYGASGPGPGSAPRQQVAVTGSRSGHSPSKNAIPSAPRGPPRKPKQSGHALWVGNLPTGVQVQDLKDYFSRDATGDIESVFLISKSNCAFVNYRTEAACAAAMTRFHDSRFKGVRLVCRYRSTASSSGPGAPSGPAALSPTAPQALTAVEAINQNREVSSKAEESMRLLEGGNKINDKYFIVKSLTIEDLELSARNGIWATQAHNEDALNKAFESVDSVYLIFSANKSGEYFGYAKMTSPINEEWASKLEWKPRTEVVLDDPKLPRSIPTPATDTAPRGRIIDDSARGTIFWEVESSEDDSDDTGSDAGAREEPTGGATDEVSGPQTFGRPFKIEWISTTRLPFYRTRGLRNPWNANRDVKIARDGTELETSVGRRLIQMFHRAATPVGPPALMSPQTPVSPMAGSSFGYPNMPPH